MRQVEVVVVATGGDLLVGVYRDGELMEMMERDGKLSDTLAPLFEELMARYSIKKIYFSRGPGSLMSIKLLYIFLTTLSLVLGIELFGCESFVFSDGKPIRASGNLYFVKGEDGIGTQVIKDHPRTKFSLPRFLKDLSCSKETAPLYHLPAVEV
jgi:hypothetical protein